MKYMNLEHPAAEKRSVDKNVDGGIVTLPKTNSKKALEDGPYGQNIPKLGFL